MTVIKDYLKNTTPTLKGFAIKLTNNRMDAEDLYQDTVIRILDNMHLFQAGSNFKAWACVIMKNEFLNKCRKSSRRQGILGNIIAVEPTHFVNKISENCGESNIAYTELTEMIESLNEDLKIPFIKMYQGYPYREIAEQMNVPLGTIKSRISYARKRLQVVYAQSNKLPLAV